MSNRFIANIINNMYIIVTSNVTDRNGSVSRTDSLTERARVQKRAASEMFRSPFTH